MLQGYLGVVLTATSYLSVPRFYNIFYYLHISQSVSTFGSRLDTANCVLFDQVASFIARQCACRALRCKSLSLRLFDVRPTTTWCRDHDSLRPNVQDASSLKSIGLTGLGYKGESRLVRELDHDVDASAARQLLNRSFAGGPTWDALSESDTMDEMYVVVGAVDRHHVTKRGANSFPSGMDSSH